MEKDILNPEEEHERIQRTMRQLVAIVKTSRDQAQVQRIRKEIRKLEEYLAKMESVVNIEKKDEEDESSANAYQVGERYPVLQSLVDESETSRKESHREGARDRRPEPKIDQEIRCLYLYFRHFDSNFLSLLSDRFLKLDFKYSLERDTFYNLFQELDRRLVDYLDENERLQKGDYFKSYETELFKRKVKMKHQILIEGDRYFGKLERFTLDLTRDIDTMGTKCLNGRLVLDSAELAGTGVYKKTIEEALRILHTLCEEIQRYINLPEIVKEE